MSVRNHFYSIDWSKISELPDTGDEFWGMAEEARESGTGWLKEIPFDDAFDYFTGLMEFMEWFQEAREAMPPSIAAAFASVFRDTGILYGEEEFAPVPIVKEVSHRWVTGAIPPDLVSDILLRLGKLDMEGTRAAFEAATSEEPCDMLDGDDAILDWIQILESGLNEIERDGHGMLMVVG